MEKKGVAYSDDFLAFWEVYPNKTGKVDAWKSWGRVALPAMDKLLSAIEQQRGSDRWRSGYIPNPATWLNQGRWEDVPRGTFREKKGPAALEPMSLEAHQARAEARQRARDEMVRARRWLV